MTIKHTKKELIHAIEYVLKKHPEGEVYIGNYGYKLSKLHGAGGATAYSLCYYNDGLYARPYSGASVYWTINLMALNKDELYDIALKCAMFEWHDFSKDTITIIK